mgnify:CR=1 FL=1
MIENPKKEKKFFLLLAVIIFLYGSFTTLDWTLFFFGIAPLKQPEIIYTRITKVTSAFLCAILAWISGKDGFKKKDTMKIRIVFASIALGEIIFLMDIYILGVISFALTQILLIWRNGSGIMEYFQNTNKKEQYTKAVLTGAVVVGIMIILYLFVIYPVLSKSPLFLLISVYAILLSISLWMALMSIHINYFEKKNAFLIAIGMSFFFIADFLVGFNLSLEIGIERVITHYLTWIFYLPALLLLALSSYQWK